MFWQNFTGEDEPRAATSTDDQGKGESSSVGGKTEPMSLEAIKMITKSLSQDRKKLNQSLEQIKKELDEQALKLESLRLSAHGEAAPRASDDTLKSDRASATPSIGSATSDEAVIKASTEVGKKIIGDITEVEQKINQLSDLGQSLSNKLDVINQRLKVARAMERQLKENELKSARELVP